MADPGTLLAALQIAGQIAESAFKLKRLWDDVRSTRKDLDELVEEVVLRGRLIGALGRNPPPTAVDVEDRETWQECYRLLQTASASIHTTVDELSNIVHRHRVTGSIRLYAHRQKLERCLKRLEKAEAVMMMAQQVHLHTLPQLILQGIERIESSTNNLLIESPVQSVAGSLLSPGQRRPTAKSSHNVKARICVRCSRNAHKAHKAPTTNARSSSIFTFRLSLHTVWQYFHVSACRIYRNVDRVLRVYYVRPNDSELFKAARGEQWAKVRGMLRNNQGSVFDVDEWGKTLLHIAASQARLAACRYLLENGLTACQQAWSDRRTPTDELSVTFRHMYKDEPALEYSHSTLRLLLTSSDEDPSAIASDPKRRFDGCSLPSTVLSLSTEAVAPCYEAIDPLMRAKFAMNTTSLDPKAVQILLGRDQNLSQAFQLLSSKKQSGYGHHKLLFRVSLNLAKLGNNHRWRAGWLDILSSIVSFESSVSSTVNFRSLYVHYVAFCLGQHQVKMPELAIETWNDRLTAIGRNWLEVLVSCGAKLKRYSKAERATLQHPEVFNWRDSRGRFYCFRVRFLMCGPTIADWRLFVVPYIYHIMRKPSPGVRVQCTEGNLEYEMAEEFWDLVENPEAFDIPGTYPKEENQLKPLMGKAVKVKSPIF